MVNACASFLYNILRYARGFPVDEAKTEFIYFLYQIPINKMMVNNVYLRLLTEAVKNVDKCTKIGIFNQFKNHVYAISMGEQPVQVCRHYKETEPYMGVIESKGANSVKVLAVEFMDKQNNVEDILVKEFRKLLHLMIDHPGTLMSTKSRKKMYDCGVLVAPRILEERMVAAMLARYYEMDGVYTMLKEKKTAFYCICPDSSGNIEHFSFEQLFMKARKERMQFVFSKVREMAEEEGVVLTDDDIKDLSTHLGAVLNGSMSPLVMTPRMNNHDKFMIKAKNILLKQYTEKNTIQ